jgi:hypothetical protein
MTRDEIKEIIYEVLLDENVLLQGSDASADVTAERRSRTLIAEGEEEEQEDPQALTVEELRHWSGVPMAAGFTPGRSVISEPLAAGFDLFGGEPSGTVDRSDAARRLSAILAEAQANRADPDDVDGGVLRPADYRGVPIARGF